MAGEIIQYQTEDGVTVIRLQARDGNVWLSQAEIAELFQVTPQAVTQHIRAIYDDGELEEAATCNDYLQVRTEGTREVSRRISVTAGEPSPRVDPIRISNVEPVQS